MELLRRHTYFKNNTLYGSTIFCKQDLLADPKHILNVAFIQVSNYTVPIHKLWRIIQDTAVFRPRLDSIQSEIYSKLGVVEARMMGMKLTESINYYTSM